MNLSKKLVKRVFLICGITGIVLILLFIFIFNFRDLPQNYLAAIPLNAETVNITNEQTNSTNSDIGLPVRVKIPQINIDNVVEKVGINSDGAMSVPSGPAEVGWFEFGPRPGEIGNAVMAGHSGWKNNIPAVFDNLYKLKIGDEISVTDESGEVVNFAIREIKRYSPSADATDVFVSNDDKAHLVLITCTGVWNKIWKSHSQRLVVFADKV
jgi:LPXTG-site transpeptidase (sortase) family protein